VVLFFNCNLIVFIMVLEYHYYVKSYRLLEKIFLI